MTATGFLVIFLIAAFLSWSLAPVFRWAAFALGAVDFPGERKIHSVPIPRIGGAVVAFSFAVTLGVAWAFGKVASSWPTLDLSAWWPVLAGVVIVFIGGLVDDIWSLPVRSKFLVQSAGALVAIGLGVRMDHVSLLGSDIIDLGFFALPLTFLWIVGITNAFNLVDGLDGLAVGLGSIATGTCAALFLLRGESDDALVLIMLLGALLGFLPHNFNPARIYLGDAGSMIIGYLLAVTAIISTQKTATALAVSVPLLVLGLPILDTLFSMLRRFQGVGEYTGRGLSQKANWMRALTRMFEADQGHFHHRLMMKGFSHRGAVLTLYAVAAGLSCFALLSVLAEYRNAGIILLSVILAAIIGISKLDYREVDLFQIGRLLGWYEKVVYYRRFFLGFLDLLLIATAYWAAFFVRFYDAHLTKELTSWYVNSFPTVLIAQFVCFYLFGLYRGVWRAMGVGDLMKVAWAVCAAAAMAFSLVVIRHPPVGTISFFVVDFLLLGFLVGGIRSAYRVLDYSHQKDTGHGGNALIYGAGRGGQLLLGELMRNTFPGLRAVGFIDDDPSLRHRTVGGMPVMGSSQDVPAILDNRLISTLLISTRTIDEGRLRDVALACTQRGVTILQAGFELHSFEPERQLFTEQSSSSLLAKKIQVS